MANTEYSDNGLHLLQFLVAEGIRKSQSPEQVRQEWESMTGKNIFELYSYINFINKLIQ